MKCFISLVQILVFCISLGLCQDVHRLKLDTLGEVLRIVKNLDSKTGAIDVRLDAMEEKIFQLKQQITSNQLDVLERMEFSKEALDDIVTSYDDNMSAIDEKQTSFDERLSSIDITLTSVDQRLAFVSERLVSLDERMTSTNDRMTSFDDRMFAIQDLFTNVSTYEQVFNIQQSISEEQNIQRMIASETCGRTQLDNLKDLLATDECSEGLHNCSSKDSCEDTLIGFRCKCQQGYRGDGIHCQDIDECIEEDNTCDVNANCINTDGSFSCLCHLGYTGDGTSCTALPCESPSHFIEDLGCVIPVTKKMSWDDAQTNCKQTFKGRLVVITSQTHLDQLKLYFDPITGWPWIGIRIKWNEGGGEGGYPIDPQSPLWTEGQPQQGKEECIVAAVGHSPIRLYDGECFHQFTSLCQI